MNGETLLQTQGRKGITISTPKQPTLIESLHAGTLRDVETVANRIADAIGVQDSELLDKVTALARWELMRHHDGQPPTGRYDYDPVTDTYIERIHDPSTPKAAHSGSTPLNVRLAVEYIAERDGWWDDASKRTDSAIYALTGRFVVIGRELLGDAPESSQFGQSVKHKSEPRQFWQFDTESKQMSVARGDMSYRALVSAYLDHETAATMQAVDGKVSAIRKAGMIDESDATDASDTSTAA